MAVKNINSLKDTCVLRRSRIITSLPAGGPAGQRNYLNAALKIETNLSPGNLLKELKKIERVLGRTRSARFAPRVIDLDILLYADKVIHGKRLTIPHPRMFVRSFVIKPLSEVI